MALDWNIGTHSGLVDIGTHRLHVKVAGPARKLHEPVLIIMHGFSSTMFEWPVAFRLLSEKHRVLEYDRAGYGESEEAAADPTAETVAQELGALLHAMSIKPPYITIAHSWGGTTSLEFLATRSVGDMAAMVFVDANTPRHFDIVPKLHSLSFVSAVSKDVDFREATGVRQVSPLSESEWNAIAIEDESEKHQKQHDRELLGLEASYATADAKQLLHRNPPILGLAPVVVVRGGTELDQQGMYKAGVAKGNGTEEERRQFREMLETWAEKDIRSQKQFLRLTAGKTNLIQSTRSGHNVQMTEPELILEAVQWAVGNRQ